MFIPRHLREAQPWGKAEEIETAGLPELHLYSEQTGLADLLLCEAPGVADVSALIFCILSVKQLLPNLYTFVYLVTKWSLFMGSSIPKDFPVSQLFTFASVSPPHPSSACLTSDPRERRSGQEAFSGSAMINCCPPLNYYPKPRCSKLICLTLLEVDSRVPQSNKASVLVRYVRCSKH